MRYRRAGKDNGCGGGEQKVLVFRCAVCKKDFKSAGQMANHETSKAHRKKIEVRALLRFQQLVCLWVHDRGRDVVQEDSVVSVLMRWLLHWFLLRSASCLGGVV